MSTIEEKLAQLSQLKEAIRNAINQAWGYEIIDSDECFDNFAGYIDGLCPCEEPILHCIKFNVFEGEDPQNPVVPTQCFPEDRCIETLPVPPEDLPGGHWQGYTFMGWMLPGSTEHVTVDDICPLTDDITLYADYQIVFYTYSFLDSDEQTQLKEINVMAGAHLGASTPPQITPLPGHVHQGWAYINPTTQQEEYVPNPNNFQFDCIPYNLTFYPYFGDEPGPEPEPVPYIVSAVGDNNINLVSIQ